MKTTKSLMILIASIAMLSAEDYGGFSGKTYKGDAPNGRFSVQAHQEKGYYKFDVEIIETRFPYASSDLLPESTLYRSGLESRQQARRH